MYKWEWINAKFDSVWLSQSLRGKGNLLSLGVNKELTLGTLKWLFSPCSSSSLAWCLAEGQSRVQCCVLLNSISLLLFTQLRKKSGVMQVEVLNHLKDFVLVSLTAFFLSFVRSFSRENVQHLISIRLAYISRYVGRWCNCISNEKKINIYELTLVKNSSKWIFFFKNGRI